MCGMCIEIKGPPAGVGSFSHMGPRDELRLSGIVLVASSFIYSAILLDLIAFFIVQKIFNLM